VILADCNPSNPTVCGPWSDTDKCAIFSCLAFAVVFLSKFASEEEDDDFVGVLDMKFEGKGKNDRKVKVLIEFETDKDWVDLEHAMSDWPEEVKAFKKRWDQQRIDEEQEKKMKKRKSEDVFTCDQDHHNPSLVTLSFCNKETDAAYWKDENHTGPCIGCSKPIVDGKRHVKGKNIRATKKNPIHMCPNHSQGCKCALCDCCLKSKLAANPNHKSPSKQGCRPIRSKRAKPTMLQSELGAEVAHN